MRDFKSGLLATSATLAQLIRTSIWRRYVAESGGHQLMKTVAPWIAVAAACLAGGNYSAIGAQPSAALHGRITDEAGNAVGQASVQIDQGGVVVATTKTESTGEYRISFAPNGEPYDLQAFLGNQGNWQLGPRLQPGEERMANLVLAPDSISGRVTALDASPLPSVVLEAVWFGPNPAATKRPTETPNTSARLVPGLWGEYFNMGSDLTNFPSLLTVPSLARVDPRIEFPSLETFGSPRLNENFYACWTGKLRIATATEYTFYLRSDDGSRVFIDGKLVVDNGQAHAVREVWGQSNLDTGDHDLKLEFFNAGGEAVCQFAWASKDFSKRVVPPEALFHLGGSASGPEMLLGTTTASPLATNAIMTDFQGRYRFSHLRPGQYQVRVCLLAGSLCFRGLTNQVFNIEPGWPLGEVDFQLAPFKKGKLHRFTRIDGLGDDKVQCCCAGSRGEVLFGTRVGLSRYDGRSFVSLEPKDGLPYSVGAICMDQKGVLWIGTEDGILDNEQGRLAKSRVPDQLRGRATSSLLSDAKGRLWIATWSDGLWCKDGKEWRKVPAPEDLVASLACLLEADDGSIWFGKQTGAGRWDGTTFLNFSRTNGFTDGRVLCACQCPAGVLWFGTDGDGAYRYNGRSFQHFTKAHGLAGDSVYAIHRDTDGVLWFATSEGVSRYNAEGFVNLTPDDGLITPKITSILRDENGLLWFGSPGGLWRYDETTFSSFSMADGLASNAANAAFRSSDGTVWIGLNGGVIHFDGERLVSLTAASGLSGIVDGITQTADGRLWFATEAFGTWPLWVSDGVQCTRPDGDGWAVVANPYGLIGQNMDVGPDGTLWFALEKDLFHFHSGKVERIGLKAQGLTNYISALHCDAKGTVWIGILNEGLARYDGSRLSPFTSASLRDIFAISSDPDGTVWIRTPRGLTCLRGTNFFNITNAQELLAGNYIETPIHRAIYRDRRGVHWFSTRHGVIRHYDSVWSSLDERDGLAGNNSAGIAEDVQGAIWIATDKGITRYQPKRTAVRAPGLIVQADREYTNFATPLQVPRGQRVSFRYDAIDTKTEPKNRWYRYDLLPGIVDARQLASKHDWQTATKQTEHSRILDRAGTYTFAVQYIDRDLNLSPATVAFLEIIPPWYQQVGSSRVDLQACKLEYSIVSPK